MNKLFKKIATLSVGLAMAIGVGVAVGKNNIAKVRAEAETTATWSSGTPSFGSSYASGTQTLNGIDWFVSCAGNNTSLGWNSSTQGANNDPSDAPLSTISQTTKYGTYQTSGGWKVEKIVVSFSNADSVTGTWYIWYSTNNGTSWTQATTGTLAASTTSISYDHGSNIGNSVRFAFGFGTTKTTKTRINISNIQVYAAKAVSYTVTKTASNCSISGPTSLDGSVDGTYEISGTGTYVAPEEITVARGSTTLTKNSHYTYYTADGVGYLDIYKSQITGNLTITASGRATYTISGASIVNGSLSPTDRIASGDDYEGTITPSSGYSLPAEITVTMGGSTLVSGTGYDYDPSDGTIFVYEVTGNVSVSGECSAEGGLFDISVTINYGNYTGDSQITGEGEANIIITPLSGYKTPLLKSDITVTNAVSWDYTRTSNSSATITLLGAEDDVTISATCPALNVYTISVTQTNGTHTGATSIQEGSSATLTFTPSSGWGQPATVSVSGATPSWNENNGVLTLSNPTDNVTVDYSAAANELKSITLSANSGSYTLGEGFVKPTVTAHYSVASDANVTNSPNLEITGFDPFTTGTQPVTFTYTEGNISKTASYTATVSAASYPETTTWTVLTDASDLAENDEVVIVADFADYAISTTQNNNNRGATSVTKDGDEVTWEGSSVQVLTIKAGTTSGTFSFYTGSGYLYAASSTNNYLRTETTKSANSSFTISIDEDGLATITAQGTNTHNLMQYNKGSTLFACYGGAQTGGELIIYKKHTQQSGTPKLIRVVCDSTIDPATGYKGGSKYVGDKIYTTDFVVKKQLDTGNALTTITDFTINGGTEYTLQNTSNVITISYTENNITKTTEVVVPAEERSATVTSVTLVQGAGVVKSYVDYAGAEWDYTDLTVQCVWTDSTFNEDLSLADLVESGDATVSPAKPSVGVTSFTVSYTYHETDMTANTVSGITVVADYVESVSWGGKSLSHFKAFSGGQLTSDTVNLWTVKATYAGAGESSALSFGTGANQFTIKVGEKTVNSLPYTWQTEDDGVYIAVVVGGVAKEDHTYAKANICATINAIDHEETHSGTVEKTATMTKDDAIAIHTASGVGDSAGVEVDHDIDENIHITGGKGTHASSVPLFWKDGMRVYAGNTLTISPENGAVIKSISLTSSGATCSAASGSSPWTITSGGGSDIVITIATKTTPINSDIVVEYEIEGQETVTVHYANQMEHFDAQKAVVKFAKAFNTAMNGTNVCSGSFENLSAGWTAASSAYTAFLSDISSLSSTEQDWAKAMLTYATAQWGSDAEAACVEKAMKTYEWCVSHYSETCNAFMSTVRPVEKYSHFSPLMLSSANMNTAAIVIIVSVVSAAAIGGYFFLRKKKED